MKLLEAILEFFFGGDISETVFIVAPSTYGRALNLRATLVEDFAAEGEEVSMRIQVQEGLEDGQVICVSFLSGGLLRGPRADAKEFSLKEAV